MNTLSVRLAAFAIFAALLLAAFLSPSARSQILASPSYLPIGVASTGNASTAWFHEPSTRQVLACQAVVTPGSGLSSIQCVAAKLP